MVKPEQQTEYKTLLDFKAKKWRKGTERTSEEIDEILYS